MATDLKEGNMGTKNVKADNWDGKSRVSNDTYRKRWDEIFGQKEIKELDESLKQSKKNRKEHTKNED
jgi:hypothetical protein